MRRMRKMLQSVEIDCADVKDRIAKMPEFC